MDNPAFADAISILMRAGVLPSGATPATIDNFVVSGARDLTGLDEFVALQMLSISGAQGVDYKMLGRLPKLHVLTLENSTIATLEAAIAPQLRVANVRRNRLVDISALESHRGLQTLDVSGNPLSDAAVATARRLKEKGVVLTIDDDEVIALNRALAAQHEEFVCYGSAERCVLTVTGLDGDEPPERVAVQVSAAKVRALLGDRAALDGLVRNRWG